MRDGRFRLSKEGSGIGGAEILSLLHRKPRFHPPLLPIGIMRINAPEGREQRQVCGQRCSALEKMMISPLMSKVNPSHLAPSHLADFTSLCEKTVKNYRRMAHAKAA